MQNCIFKSGLADIPVKYEFFNRSKTPFSSNFYSKVKNSIDCMSNLCFGDDEIKWMSEKFPFFDSDYLDKISKFRYNPENVRIAEIEHNLELSIFGSWFETILWEVPIMSIISELYHQENNVDIDYELISSKAKEKARKLIISNCNFSDFGTRRRHSSKVQSLILLAMSKVCPQLKTSNLDYAKFYDLTPVGTCAHEFIMAHAALFSYEKANQKALECWYNVYGDKIGAFPTDTFTSPIFFRDFGKKFAESFLGVRQDSGDPIQLAEMAIRHYENLGIEPSTKTVIFSNQLTVDECIRINNWCDKKIKASFGIGTHFTCDIPGIVPLNMVIKMTQCNGKNTIKLSDDTGKNTGSQDDILMAKSSLNI